MYVVGMVLLPTLYECSFSFDGWTIRKINLNFKTVYFFYFFFYLLQNDVAVIPQDYSIPSVANISLDQYDSKNIQTCVYNISLFKP